MDTVHCLQIKQEILEQIAAKTETLSRFIKLGKFKWLGEVLAERSELIKELRTIQEKLLTLAKASKDAALQKRSEDMALLEQRILKRSREVLADITAERARIADELRKSKAGRHIQYQYVNPYAIVARGRRVNLKG